MLANQGQIDSSNISIVSQHHSPTLTPTSSMLEKESSPKIVNNSFKEDSRR